ncbi:FixH family protein [Christiangramia forsetii]|uniref:FixH-like protein n=2 Tax=Christiangramia forsetii TaxID=411153 RepID=A0M1B6_CHRFK|nr:FixH family protein [Christiangramia forsetii]GGG42914.1 cytochrome Cbb3 oxidase maturation protein CcoH [Christiangramia forsetii]CAL66411.1 FixH-like protein [Christiangramia forsetii KT0803]
MKINWGTGIVIGMVLFISFIMYFVITMLSSSEFDHDLVVEDYYKAELHYQQEIDAEENALALKEHIQLERNGSELKLKFPEHMNISEIEGSVNFYRTSNKELDFSIPFKKMEELGFIVPETQLIKGRWNIKISWLQNDKEFLFKKEILY